jgi:hypothetical protein
MNIEAFVVLHVLEQYHEVQSHQPLQHKAVSRYLISHPGGPDELKPRLLANQEITITLCLIFNKSLTEGIVSEDWKRAITVQEIIVQ